MPCSPHPRALSDRVAAAAGGTTEVRKSHTVRAKSRRRKFFSLTFLLSLALPRRVLGFFAASTAVHALLPVSLLPRVPRLCRFKRSVADSPKMSAAAGKLDQGPGPSKGEERGRDSMVCLSPPVLELITPNGCASSADPAFLIRSVQRAVAGGVSLVQLRDYDSDYKSKANLARRLHSAIDGRACFVLNGEPDAARACGADGVHLPERIMQRLVGLRSAGGWPRVVGCSVHSVAAAVEAARLGADYVQVRSTLTNSWYLVLLYLVLPGCMHVPYLVPDEHCTSARCNTSYTWYVQGLCTYCIWHPMRIAPRPVATLADRCCSLLLQKGGCCARAFLSTTWCDTRDTITTRYTLVVRCLLRAARAARA